MKEIVKGLPLPLGDATWGVWQLFPEEWKKVEKLPLGYKTEYQRIYLAIRY